MAFTGKKVLVIKSSPMGDNSASNKVTDAFISEYSKLNPHDKISTIDLPQRNLEPFSAKRVLAKFASFVGPDPDTAEWEYSKSLIKEFLDADKYVIAAGMWNFSVPYYLKLYIDHIVQPNKTFEASGKGLVTQRPALLVLASGGGVLGTPYDFETPYLKQIFSFIGFTDIRTIFVNGSSSAEAVQKASEEARLKAADFNFNPEAKVTPESSVGQESQKKYKSGNKVLAILASPLGDHSASTRVAKALIEEYKKKKPEATVKTVELHSRNIQPFSAKRVQAKFATFAGNPPPEGLADEWKATLDLIEEFKWADTYIFAIPMWNFGIPYILKLYLDHIIQPHQTFDPRNQKDGGLIKGKPAYVISASGGGLLGNQAGLDHVSGYVRSVLGFIGFEDLRQITINGTSNPANLQTLVETASRQAIAAID